jgi:hypothetical protein
MFTTRETTGFAKVAAAAVTAGKSTDEVREIVRKAKQAALDYGR